MLQIVICQCSWKYKLLIFWSNNSIAVNILARVNKTKQNKTQKQTLVLLVPLFKKNFHLHGIFFPPLQFRSICFWSGSLVQFGSIAQSCLTLCDPMNHSTPGLPVHHQLTEFTQTYVHRVDDVIQPSHPLSSPSHPALNLSQQQGFFKWVRSSHQVAKVLEF